MIGPADLSFALLATNPIGGLLVAIPFAIFQLHYPLWIAALAGVPFAYVQVLVIDLGWDALVRFSWWSRLVERRRSRWVERLVASRGGFWITFFATPFIGPWLVMALMRYARVSQRTVALPIMLSLACTGGILATACALVPRLFVK
jgi:hypothetical protein